MITIVQQLFWLSVLHNFKLTAAFIPGRLNILSDRLSRLDVKSSANEGNWLLTNGQCNIIQCVGHMTHMTFSPFTDRVDEDWSRLVGESRAYKQSAFSVNTKRAYKSQVKSYLKFCQDFRRAPVPASVETISCYASFLARRMLPQSVNCYMNVIRLLHLEAGLPNPLHNCWQLAMVKKGLARQKGTPPAQKAPMSTEILLKIVNLLDFSLASDTSFWAACLIGFFGLLRKSTLLPVNETQALNKTICRKDVIHMNLQGFTIIVRSSKTIQFGQRLHQVPFVRVSNPLLCPVKALLTHLGQAHLSPDTPLFAYSQLGVTVNLYHARFVTRLRAYLVTLGYDPQKHRAQARRRGGVASLCFRAGLSILQIKQRGDWVSNAVEQYIFIDEAFFLWGG
jgi:hypothetical protein